jgi:hypothetical protein
MPESPPEELQLYEFVLDEIDSVPHLETLLLLWNNRTIPWRAEDLSKRLYVNARIAKTLLQDLARQGFLRTLSSDPELYEYQDGSEPRDRMMGSTKPIAARSFAFLL